MRSIPWSPSSLLVGLFASMALIACGTTQFPSNEEVQRLAARPAASHPQQGDVADVEEWALVGPLPDQVGEQVALSDGLWNGLLAELAKRRPGLLMASGAANCAARELGVFFAAKRARMAESLQTFIAARCGMTGTPQLSHGYRYQEIVGEADEQKLFAEWSPVLRDELQKAVGNTAGPQLIGLWFGRRDGIALASWVVVPRQVRVDPIAMVPSGVGQVVVRGEVLSRIEHIEALANRGAYGFKRCEVDPKVRMPQFSLRCDVDQSDVSTNIQIAAFEPGRVLGHTILSLLVWPKGELGNRYRRPSLADKAAGKTAESSAGAVKPSGDVATDLVALVGGVRSQAGMKALRLSAPQSQTARRLAPHYFAAIAGLESETVADQVVLGLRAGWEVGAPLRSGQFTYGGVEGSFSAARLLSEVLDVPGGREALLDPEADHLAVGVIGSPALGFVGVLFGTYATFELGDTRGHAEKVRARLDNLRAQKGLAKTEMLPNVEADLSAVVRQVSAGEVDVDQGLNRALSVAAERTQGEVRAHYVDAFELDQITIPDEIVSMRSLRVAIAVGQHQPKGDPWRRYIVYFVIVGQSDVVASR
jgi:hypothetical protein